MRDTGQLMSIPLEGYETFIDDFTDFVARMPEMMRYARGTVAAEPISLRLSIDGHLMKRITRQVRASVK